MTPSLEHAILLSMMVGEVNRYPIQLLVNYWEVRPALMGAYLDELICRGVTHIASFVPWQALESDISHSLPRYLQSLSERNMTITLILSPEVGIHYPNSGLPKDAISKSENLAQNSDQTYASVHLPPNAHSLPSFFSPEFSKRYYGFLGKLDGILGDLARNQPQLLDKITLTLSGSFWKYYRSPRQASRKPFKDIAGDYSTSAGLAYRQQLDQFYQQKEFNEPSPGSVNKWRGKGQDEINRRWFQRQSEDVFRSRSLQQFKKKSGSLRMQEMEIFTPEADPAYTYAKFLRAVAGVPLDFAKLSRLIDEASARQSVAQGSATQAFVHWTQMGDFGTLGDAERQFLFLKALLLLGSQGGGVLIAEKDWFNFSASFRARAENFARLLSQKDLRLKNRALYLTSHLWSQPGLLWEHLLKKLGAEARMVSSLDLVLHDPDANLLIVDSQVVITRELILKLSAWAKSGRVLVLPKSSLMTEQAKAELESISAQSRRIEVNLGLPYKLHALGEGKLILFEMPDNVGEGQLETFVTASLAVAEVEIQCALSERRAEFIPLSRRDQGYALFLLNGTRQKVVSDLIFSQDVSVSDLAASLTTANKPTQALPANRFSLEIPICGILPLAVEATPENIARAMTTRATLTSAKDAPSAPDQPENLWN